LFRYNAFVKSRRIVMPLLGCVLAGLVVVFLVGSDHQPRYHGRSLSSWLLNAQVIWSGHLTRPGWEETSDAIRHIGTNGLPYVLQWMTYERPPWRTQMLATLQKFPKAIGANPELQKLVLGNGEARADATVWVFRALGAQASDVAPDLLRLFLDPTRPVVSKRAQTALESLGENALASLTAAVMSGKLKQRTAYVSWVSRYFYAAEDPTLQSVLLDLTGDKDREVAVEAINTVGQRAYYARTVRTNHASAASALPVLIERLEDPRPTVRIAAAQALSSLDEDGRSALVALKKLFNDEDYLVRDQATNSLHDIAPDLFPPTHTHPPRIWRDMPWNSRRRDW
jgi:hypothetical protein